MMSHLAMSLGDRLCASREGGAGGGGRVQTAWPCLGSASWLEPGRPFQMQTAWPRLGSALNNPWLEPGRPFLVFNPLTTEFFPPRQHIFMHSAHTTFVGTPLPQHSLLSGQTWWGPHTWRDPSGNTVNDIHDPPQGQQSEVKGGCQPDFRPAFP